MQELCADLFENLHTPNHVVGLSTNGTIKRNGQGVMGRGCAFEASQRYPQMPSILGMHLKVHGNVPGWVDLTANSTAMRFLILPVKHQWYQKADVDLIIMSTRWLEEQAKLY